MRCAIGVWLLSDVCRAQGRGAESERRIASKARGAVEGRGGEGGAECRSRGSSPGGGAEGRSRGSSPRLRPRSEGGAEGRARRIHGPLLTAPVSRADQWRRKLGTISVLWCSRTTPPCLACQRRLCARQWWLSACSHPFLLRMQGRATLVGLR